MLQSTAISFDLTHRVVTELDVEHLQCDLQEKNIVYWFHCDGHDEKALAMFTKMLKLPEELLALCKGDNPMPKLIDNQDNLVMQLQSLLNENPNAEQIEFGSLIIYLTNGYCFTFTREDIPAIEHFKKVCYRSVRYARSPCFVLFLILDHVINLYSETLLELDISAEQLDLKIREFEEQSYEMILNEEKKVMRVKRYAAALQEMLMRMSGRKIPVITEPCRLSLGNLFDHSQIVVREAEAVRDALRGSLAQIDNSLMRRLNDTMRVLTAFAAIFLPLSLIAGIYGMNFHFIPELGWKFGYFFALGMMLITAIGLIYLFKKKKWF